MIPVRSPIEDAYTPDALASKAKMDDLIKRFIFVSI